MKMKINNYTVMIIMIISFILALNCVAKETAATEEPKKEQVKKKGPKMEHAGTLPGELCVGCHMESETQDPESTTPRINTNHDVCNRCHKPDGSVTEGHCGCEDVSNPMDCETCHTTPAIGDNPSAEEMNALCLACH